MEKLKGTEFVPVEGKLKFGFKTLMAKEADGYFYCESCYFKELDDCVFGALFIFGGCLAKDRPDNKNVYFVECKE